MQFICQSNEAKETIARHAQTINGATRLRLLTPYGKITPYPVIDTVRKITPYRVCFLDFLSASKPSSFSVEAILPAEKYCVARPNRIENYSFAHVINVEF